MNTTPKTPLVLLADAADELHKLADRLTDAAEELLPETPTPAPLVSRAALAGWLLAPLATFKRSGTPGGEFQIADEVIRFLQLNPRTFPAEPEDPAVERMAIAIHGADRPAWPWPDEEDDIRDTYRRLARAALDVARADA